ncbi:hypothetical protein [Capnocytophaga gingivalis]|uniref:PQQ enzyme repeat protein n=1 Tax=Capnocytophaga gingivalis TaxID=1017 RepID=A0ABU5Y989_9FLAO|nr:hypothetical protein [Capnocytophaga gingivalis]MEB3040502.1 hypothetical protein [Capnocytophaga gingivalis]
MYKKISSLQKTNGLYLLDNKLYTFLNNKELLGEFSLQGEMLWSVESFPIYYRYHIDSNRIIFYEDREEENLVILDRKTKEVIYKNKIKLNITDDKCYIDNILYSFIDDRLIVYDLEKFSIIENREDTVEGIIFIPINKFIVSRYSTSIYIYIKNNLSLLWQQNIQDFFPGEEELSILEIYSYKDTFIIIARVGIVCLSQKDGSLIWKCDYYARTMEIVGHYGYVCTSLSFYRVDLDNGEKYGYGRKYDRLPDFEYNGENHWPSGHRVVYHKGLLWYDVHTSKHPFIIAIDPETGNYQWIHEITSSNQYIENIKFYDNRMFVTDTDYNLFIYEEE